MLAFEVLRIGTLTFGRHSSRRHPAGVFSLAPIITRLSTTLMPRHNAR
jgi:hypothetical protein